MTCLLSEGGEAWFAMGGWGFGSRIKQALTFFWAVFGCGGRTGWRSFLVSLRLLGFPNTCTCTPAHSPPGLSCARICWPKKAQPILAMARSGAGTAVQQDSHPTIGSHARPGWPLVCVVQPACRRVLAALSLTHDTPHYGPPSPGEGCVRMCGKREQVDEITGREREGRERCTPAHSIIFLRRVPYFLFSTPLFLFPVHVNTHTHTASMSSQAHTRARTHAPSKRARNSFDFQTFILSLSLPPAIKILSPRPRPC